jgi:hypothetical protein
VQAWCAKGDLTAYTNGSLGAADHEDVAASPSRHCSRQWSKKESVVMQYQNVVPVALSLIEAISELVARHRAGDKEAQAELMALLEPIFPEPPEL